MEAQNFEVMSQNGHYELHGHRIDPTNKATLYAKMARVMADLSDVKKDAQHGQGWKYAGIDTITSAIRQSLGQNGIAFFAEEIECNTLESGDIEMVYHFTFACADTGATVTKRWTGIGSKHLRDKARNAASTNAQKYFLIRNFVMTYADDVDGDSVDAPPQQAKPEPRKRKNDRRIQDWTQVQEKQTEFIELCIELGLGETREEVGATLKHRYKPGVEITSLMKITDTWNQSVARVKEIAAELKAGQPEPAAGQSDDPATPYHERLSDDEVHHLWEQAEAIIDGDDAAVAAKLAAEGLPVDTRDQRIGIMRDFLMMSDVSSKVQADEALAGLGKA